MSIRRPKCSSVGDGTSITPIATLSDGRRRGKLIYWSVSGRQWKQSHPSYSGPPAEWRPPGYEK